jgi:hypothetical protein
VSRIGAIQTTVLEHDKDEDRWIEKSDAEPRALRTDMTYPFLHPRGGKTGR